MRRAEAGGLVERLIWLAGGAPMPEVRAEASHALATIQNGVMFLDGQGVGNASARELFAADIKRVLERPMEPIRSPSTFDAPPGAPIGDGPLDWRAPPPRGMQQGGAGLVAR